MAHRNTLGTLLSLLVLSSLFALTGCGDFDSGFTDGNDAWRSSNELFTARVVGSVGDGPIVNARLRVFTNSGVLLLETSSNSTADYDLTVKARGRDFPLTIKADQGTDIVTNAVPDFALASVIMQPGNRETVNLNPYSTLIVKAAQNAGGIDDETIAKATEAVVTRYGFGLNTELVPDPLFTPMDQGNVHVIVKASETLGEMIRRTRDALVTSGRAVDGDGVVEALAADLSDGWIDGRGAEGRDPRIAAVANVASAAVLVEAMANRLHVNDVEATQAMDNAILQVRPLAPISSRTRNVSIPAEALDQSLRSLRAAKLVRKDTRIAEIYERVAAAEPGTTELDALSSGGIQTMSSGFHNPLNDATLAVAYVSDDDELDRFNAAARAGPPSDSGVSDGNDSNPGDEGTTDPGADGDPEAGDDVATVPITDGDPNYGDGTPTTDGETTTGTQPNDDQQVQEGAPANLWANDGWLLFDGGKDSLLNTSLSLTELSSGSFTFEAFVQFTGERTRNWSPIFGSSANTFSSEEIFNIGKVNGSDELRVNIGGLDRFSVSGTDLFDGNERHVAVVFDRGSDEIRVFVDHELVARRPKVTGSVTTKSELLLGATGHESDERWKGWIGPHRVTNQALSTEQFLGGNGKPVAPRPNAAPTISGTPETALVVGNPWSFTPPASDPDGDRLTFSIQNKPEWAAFDSRTGEVSGTPTSKGSFGDIIITVSDGAANASLTPFTLQVDTPTLGAATVSWEPPTTRTDGSTLTDLAGYRVYYGKNDASLTHVVEIGGAGQTSHHVENLDAGTWYFAVTALSGEGLESPKSEIGSKEILY